MNDQPKQTEMDARTPTITRRDLVKGAAWSLPVIAMAVPAPAYAQSGLDVGAFSLNGSCGTLGILGPGFTLTAGPQPLPVGTTITIIGSGVANIGAFSATGTSAPVTILTATSRQVVLDAELAAGATAAFRTTLSISVSFTLNAAVSLPSGFTATGAKTSGTVSSTLILCSAT